MSKNTTFAVGPVAAKPVVNTNYLIQILPPRNGKERQFKTSHKEMSESKCDAFLRNPGRNPESGYLISEGARVYKGLVKECGSPPRQVKSRRPGNFCAAFQENPARHPDT